jgi:DNA-binding transcriptional LysR family regulator
MLDVTRLRVLVAVARHGSVTAAAKALNYAQPSVSHHLARLEAETGTKLIQRAGRGIRLTDAGRLLAERAAEVIGRLDAAENELAAYAGLRAGRLRLAAFPSALGTIVPAAAAMLHAQHPTVDLRLTEAEPPEALRMLRAGYVDVALVFRHSNDALRLVTAPAGDGTLHTAGPAAISTAAASTAAVSTAAAKDTSAAPRDPGPGIAANTHGEAPAPAGGVSTEAEGIRENLLLEEPVQLVTAAHARPDAVLPASLTELWPADLTRFAGHRWIAGCDRCREHMLRQCALAGFTPKIAFTTDDFVAVQALVKAGLGVAMLPALALRAARNPGVRTVKLRGTRRCVLAVRYGEPPDPPATALLMEVLRAAADAMPRPHDIPSGGSAAKPGQLDSAP